MKYALLALYFFVPIYLFAEETTISAHSFITSQKSQQCSSEACQAKMKKILQPLLVSGSEKIIK